MTREMLTTKEVAEYLSINEKQVYRLIKEKKIPATRITGKWLFPKNLINEWILASARESVRDAPQKTAPENQVVIAGSNDLALELLVKNTNLHNPGYTISISNLGSLAGLISLQHGDCHIAASHLLDHDTGEYNSPFIRKFFPNMKVILLNVAYREQGLIVRKGNPKGIKTLNDLTTQKVTFVNRQEGSGTRVLLDYRLKESGIDPADIPGYFRSAYTHMEVALDVFSGGADAGMGIMAVARSLELDFIPLARERFDLIIPEMNYNAGAVKALREVLSSEDFKSTIVQMGGYAVRDTGKVVYEKA
ncbi:MAG TPA: substrate-binding domain-containing protein [Acidobacteriota bacterium]|nr:substrate-binding domain-containing protein [Acidobacteriota bacterium]